MKSAQILATMKVLSWIVFVGICIKAGVFIISFFISLFGDPFAANHLYMAVDVGDLHSFNSWYYFSSTLLVIVLLILRAYIFYLVIKVFSKFNLDTPFSLNVSKLISKIGYIALTSGIISVFSSSYTLWLEGRGFYFPYNFGGTEFLLMSGIVFIIAFLFKRGIEIQQENDLTI